ncbi:hypothetical protein T02_9311 [Trichinella nativa]|uniref:Uncharacterized protein n=1 Tax=Trichinella nativa TaxID=6335 RepID=A0A0V1KXH8_9BILA|nr:hypothetical protein T02_9311 [Trichinella nativa]
MTLQHLVHLLEITVVEGDQRFGSQHGLVVVQFFAHWQRPEETSQTLHISRLLQYFTYTSHLFLKIMLKLHPWNPNDDAWAMFVIVLGTVIDSHLANRRQEQINAYAEEGYSS